MAWDTAVTTVQLTFGKASGTLGEAGGAQITVTPIFTGTSYLVWAATGDVWVPSVETATAPSGMLGSLAVPAVDQTGWQDEFGNSYKNWSYLIAVNYTVNGKTVIINRSFNLLAGTGPIDIDVTPSSGASIPQIVLAYPVKTINGLGPDSSGNIVVAGSGGGAGAVSSVAGRTGAVTLTKTDVGLPNVDNTSDVSKPISNPTASALASKADLVGGLVPTSQIPALALTTSTVVASQAAMLALTSAQVQPGDLAIRTDGAGTFILNASDPSVLGNWTRLNAPTDVVTSVAGQTGTVVLSKSDVGLSAVDNTADTDKPVSAAQALAITSAKNAALNGSLSNSEPGALVTSPDGASTSGLWTPGRGQRPLPNPSKVISRFPSGHGWTGGSDDTTTVLFSDRSYKGTSLGTAANTYLTSPTLTAFDASSSILRLIFKVDDPSKLSQLTLLVTTGTGNSFQGNLQYNLIAGEWYTATINRSQFTVAAGTPVWTGVTKFDVRYKDNGGSAPVTIWLAALELIPDLSATYPTGVFILECDDGYAGQITNMLPVTSVRGIPVTINPIIDRITSGTNGITADTLRTLQDKHGWEISVHAYATAVHNTLSSAAVLDQDFQRAKQWLHANGLHHGADELALCPGTGSPVPEGSVMNTIRRNFRSARINNGFYETAIPGDQMRLRSILFSGNTNAQLQTNIAAVAGAGGALIFTVHDVLAGSTNGTSNSLPAMAAANLATILDYAASLGMVFRTRADYLDRR